MAPSGEGSIIYLVGTAGNPHYGDEVITASWLRYYADRFPNAEVWLDTPRPGQTAVLHGRAHPRLRCVDTLFHACWNAPSESAADCVAFGSAVIDDPGRISREASGVAAAQDADLVHVLGGGYINALWPRHLTLLGAASRLGERFGARTAITGAGLLPATQDSASVLAGVLSGFDVVDVRDSGSSDLVAGAVVHHSLTGDDALLDLQRQRVDSNSLAPTVVEVQSDLLDVPLADLADHVMALLRAWGSDKDPVLLLESLPPGDSAVLALLEPHLPQVSMQPFQFLWRQGFPAGPRQRWITTRYHSHLLAAASGAWGVALAGSRLIGEQHRSLIETGSGWTLVEDSTADVPLGQPTRSPFAGGYGDLVAGKRAVAEKVTAALR